MLKHLAQKSGIETPTAEDLIRLDRNRKGKKLSNQDWVSKNDPEAKIARMKDGTTHLAYKPEHAVDLDTGAVVAAELHPADEGDTTTLGKTLAAAEASLKAVDLAPTVENPAECVADKGYHARAVLKDLDNSPWKTRISEPKQAAFRVGVVTRQRVARSLKIACGSSLVSPARPSSCVPSSSSAPLPITLIVAACAERGCVDARTCISDTCFTSPATTCHC